MDSKSKLTGGTIFIIVLIVLIFGNIGSRQVDEQLKETHQAILRNGEELNRLRYEIKALKEENIKLSKQLLENNQ